MIRWEDKIWAGTSEGNVLTKIHGMELYLLKFKIEIGFMNLTNEIDVNIYDCDGYNTDPILNEELSFTDKYIYKREELKTLNRVGDIRDENNERLLSIAKKRIIASERKKKIANLLKQ